MKIFRVLLMAALSSGAAAAKKPETAAKEAFVMEAKTRRVLYAKEPHTRTTPSSMTKVMTAYLLLNAIKKGELTLQDVVPVSKKAWKVEGSRMFIEPRNKPTVEEILNGIMVVSGNDASIAAAEKISGSEKAFATLMNETAHEMGLKDTRFNNASGLPHADHYSTVYELAHIAAHVIKAQPAILDYAAKDAYEYNNIKQPNLNVLLNKLKEVDGLKTGHSSAGGYGLIATAKRDHTRLISVVNGCKTHKMRTDESEMLILWGLQHYHTALLHAKGTPVVDVPIWLGARSTVSLVPHQNVYVTLNKKAPTQDVSITIHVPNVIKEETSKNESVGFVKVVYKDEGFEQEKRFPLYPLHHVKKASIWQRVPQMIKYFVNYHEKELKHD